MFTIRKNVLRISLAILTSLPLYAAVDGDDTKAYEVYMRQLIKLSHQNPRYPFAAMIIHNKTGVILCTGVNAGYKNPTYHGEMVAINNCAAKYPRLDWTQTTLITDAEPCSMCSSAIIWANIPKTVYGSSVPFMVQHHWQQINIRAQEVFNQSPFYKGVVIGGVLHHETDRLFLKAQQLSPS